MIKFSNLKDLSYVVIITSDNRGSLFVDDIWKICKKMGVMTVIDFWSLIRNLSWHSATWALGDLSSSVVSIDPQINNVKHKISTRTFFWCLKAKNRKRVSVYRAISYLNASSWGDVLTRQVSWKFDCNSLLYIWWPEDLVTGRRCFSVLNVETTKDPPNEGKLCRWLQTGSTIQMCSDRIRRSKFLPQNQQIHTSSNL